jgi:hypothetical protein
MKPKRRPMKCCNIGCATKVGPPAPQVQHPIYSVIEFPVLTKVEDEVKRFVYDDLKGLTR